MHRRQIRLLFLPRESYPTDRVRINVLIGKALLSRGHKIDLVMQAADATVGTGLRPWRGQTIWIGPTDAGGSLLRRLRKHWLSLRHDLQSLRRARPSDYDVVMVSDKFIVAAIALQVARARGLRFVFWLTFPYPELALLGAREGTARYPRLALLQGRFTEWLLYRWILPRSDHVFVQTERMGRGLLTRGIPSRRISPILTGFGIDEIPAHAVKQHYARVAVPVIVYLGTLSADRHLEVLIDMLARLQARGTPARLLLIGDAHRGRDRVRLEQSAVTAGVSQQVEITGFLPHAEALRRTVTADVAISPIFRSPIYDVGSPTKLIEYLALGMPVVANDHPEQREILLASKAGVCTPWSGSQFARAVSWILARRPEERFAMGSRGRAWVEKHRSYATIADGVEETLRALSQAPQERRVVAGSGRCPD